MICDLNLNALMPDGDVNSAATSFPLPRTTPMKWKVIQINHRWKKAEVDTALIPSYKLVKWSILTFRLSRDMESDGLIWRSNLMPNSNSGLSWWFDERVFFLKQIAVDHATTRGVVLQLIGWRSKLARPQLMGRRRHEPNAIGIEATQSPRLPQGPLSQKKEEPQGPRDWAVDKKPK